jgi:hypothetical protein
MVEVERGEEFMVYEKKVLYRRLKIQKFKLQTLQEKPKSKRWIMTKT